MRRIMLSMVMVGVVSGLVLVSPAQAAGKTIPVFTLKGQLAEKPASEDFPFGPRDVESFRELVARIDKAADDAKVPAVVLFHDGASIGYAQLEELRHTIDRLQAKGKKVYSHSDWTMTGGYALLAQADRLSMTPTGYLFITGIYGEQMYVRGLLDKLGVQPDFVTCGEYKSAAEMFMRSGPSPKAAEMYGWLYDGLYDALISHIAAGRQVDAAKAKSWIDTGLYSAETAQKEGLIDAVEHRDQFVAELKKEFGDDVTFDKKYGRKSQPTVDFNNPFAVMQFYMQLLAGPQTTRSTKDSIAIVYVEGSIYPGSPEPGTFGATEGAYSDPIRKALDKAAEDDTVKAVVLRVNSPGGSAVASEVIMRACQRVAAKKPLVVSMGNVAASGGYYVTLASKQVFADQGTITGSIGVLGGKLATTDMWSKIGVTFNPIERGARAGMLGTGKAFSTDERAHFQQWMDEVYEVFKQHVTDIRGEKLKKPIDELAGGRVFTGQQALEFGLVDRIGSLQDAVVAAAKDAEIEKYEIRVIPRPENFIEVLLSDLSGQGDGDDKQRLSLRSPGGDGSSLWDAAAPLLQGLDPERVRLVQQALDQLDLLQSEQVLMTAPVLELRMK
ncbi:MAG: signal peptide peptidase SppA [Planctomycetaceae bacterium]